jgi:hypothetical protein
LRWYICGLVRSCLSRVVLPEPGFPTSSIKKCGSRYSFSSSVSFTPSTWPWSTRWNCSLFS